ncbi:MAG: hypothetical protein QNJ97_00070 [Myxococcota bacterium]|nr:hypothetical protein [Myxococcota bacterium]
MKKLSCLCLVGLLAGLACEQTENEEHIFEAEDKGLNQAEFVLLHKEGIENGNEIEFYELDLEPGLILISEVGIVPNPPTRIGTGTVEEIFHRISPEKEIPLVLRTASLRQQAFFRTQKGETIAFKEEIAYDEANELEETSLISDSSGRDVRGPEVSLCDPYWFQSNICESVTFPDYKWFWANETTNRSKYLGNIMWGMRTVICADIKTTRMVVKARDFTQWETRVDADVLPGTYRWYWAWNGQGIPDVHDFKSYGYPDPGARYHFCGGACD